MILLTGIPDCNVILTIKQITVYCRFYFNTVNVLIGLNKTS